MYGVGVTACSVEENSALMQPPMLDRALLQALIGCALGTVRGLHEVDEKQVAAMGCRFGGLCVLDLALQTEFTGAGADWQVHAYGNTVHTFTNPRVNGAEFGTVYNELTDVRLWQAVLSHLQ